MNFFDADLSLAGLDHAGVFEGIASDATQSRNGYTYAPDAFVASIADHARRGTMPALLLYHDAQRPVGKWLQIEPRPQGLWVRGRLTLDVADGQYAYSLLKSGAVAALSTGAVSVREKNAADGSRLIAEADLVEVSLCPAGANRNAKILRVSSVNARAIEDVLREAGLSSRKAKAAGAAAYRALQSSTEPAEPALTSILQGAITSLSRFHKEPTK
jgi:HK97 family phage prohead protease